MHAHCVGHTTRQLRPQYREAQLIDMTLQQSKSTRNYQRNHILIGMIHSVVDC
jgi:hypothetical protein